jgi:hypothetical protein
LVSPEIPELKLPRLHLNAAQWTMRIFFLAVPVSLHQALPSATATNVNQDLMTRFPIHFARANLRSSGAAQPPTFNLPVR